MKEPRLERGSFRSSGGGFRRRGALGCRFGRRRGGSPSQLSLVRLHPLPDVGDLLRLARLPRLPFRRPSSLSDFLVFLVLVYLRFSGCQEPPEVRIRDPAVV